MANIASTIEYKFKVTNNLDKDSTAVKKFNFYIGLPYSKRKYRYMQVVNFATNKEGQHLFNVVLGHSESSVAAMTEDILRGTHASLKPVATKVSRISYVSLNVGTSALICNDKNEEIIKNGDWTGISGEYMKVKSFRTNGNDEVIGLIFDAADRNIVFARKNDGTNVVAKAEASDDIVKVPQPDEVKLDPILLTSTARKAIKDSVDDLRKANQAFERKVRNLEYLNECLKKDLEARDKNIEELCEENNEFRNKLKGTESKPDETQKTFRDKFIDLIVDMFREKLETLTDDELLRYRKE